MLANESEFEVLLTRYEDDPAICSKLLRTHALTDPKIFLGYAQTALLRKPVSRALKFIAGVALSAGLSEFLLDLHAKDRPQCLILSQKMMLCEPRFDLTLLEFLQRAQPDQAHEEALLHAGLDILGHISQGDRLVPGVLKILKHPNPKVRSKAALFIGSRTQNIAWAASRAQEYDARVRANIIESLYGIRSEFVLQIFRNNTADENNRVTGNAILGLYLLGDAASIPLIHDLARHPDARFRNTCAWVMGRTRDPRFAQSFSELLNDSDEIVRAQAFKGLTEIRKAVRANASRPELRSSLVRVHSKEAASLLVTVHDSSSQPVSGIPATGFVLKSGTPAKPARQFTVEEYECRSPLSVAFLLCLPEQEQAAAETSFIQALQACQPLRRAKDRWTVIKLSPKLAPPKRPGDSTGSEATRYRHKWSVLNVDVDPGGGHSASNSDPVLEFSVAQPRIDAMLREAPVTIGADTSDDATNYLLSFLLRSEGAWGNPHLIFFGAGPHQHLVQPLARKGADLPATVHVLAQSDTWREPAAREVAIQTGGAYRSLRDPAALHQACFETYSSLLHHYRIAAPETSADTLALDIYCEAGRASAACETLTPAGVLV